MRVGLSWSGLKASASHQGHQANVVKHMSVSLDEALPSHEGLPNLK